MDVTTDWIIGFILALIAQICLAASVQTFARAHRNIEIKHKAALLQSSSGITDDTTPQQKQSYLCNKCWLLGLLFTIVGGPCDMLSYGYAPASLIAPLGSLLLIFNMCLNPIINGESVSRYTIIVTLVICAGTVITVIWSPSGSEQEGNDIGEALKDIYISWYFAGFSIFATIFIFSLWMATIRWKDNLRVYGVVIPALSGTLSALNKIIGKGMAIGFKFTFRGYGCFCVEWLWYLAFIGIFVSLFAHLKWLNRGLAAFSPVHIIPINSTFAMLVVTIGGLVIFQEIDQFRSVLSIIMFSVGILTIIAGVVALAKKDQSKRGKTTVADPVFLEKTLEHRWSTPLAVISNKRFLNELRTLTKLEEIEEISEIQENEEIPEIPKISENEEIPETLRISKIPINEEVENIPEIQENEEITEISKEFRDEMNSTPKMTEFELPEMEEMKDYKESVDGIDGMEEIQETRLRNQIQNVFGKQKKMIQKTPALTEVMYRELLALESRMKNMKLEEDGDGEKEEVLDLLRKQMESISSQDTDSKVVGNDDIELMTKINEQERMLKENQKEIKALRKTLRSAFTKLVRRRSRYRTILSLKANSFDIGSVNQ